MGPASAVNAAFAVAALCTAILNFWIFAVHRRERAHLWLGVTALGIVGLAATTAALYECHTVAHAQRIQLLCLSAAVPVVLGFLRFTAHVLRIDLRRLEWAANVYTVLAVGAMWVRPDWMFSGESIARVALGGTTYVQAALVPSASFVFSGFLAVFGALVPLYWKHLDRVEVNGRAVFAAVCLWFLCGCNDTAVFGGLYRGVSLMAVGYGGFVAVFTAALVRRMVTSMVRVEASAETLGRLVEERTEALRQKDLQIAHGERMATLGTLAAGVAHEINNPLAFVSANLNHLADAWKTPEGQGDVPEILDETREGVERIQAIVRELLTLARRGEGVSEPVDLRMVVGAVLPILRHEARGRAQLETRLDPVPPVLGDERLLGQVVLNLVVNALHAVPEGEPETQRVSIATRYEDGSAWLVVRDTGSGIPEEVLPRIFDPFFTTKEQGKGTGLGLAVTHQLVGQHRGRIDVSSGPDGTTVTVEFPPVPPGTGGAAAPD